MLGKEFEITALLIFLINSVLTFINSNTTDNQFGFEDYLFGINSEQ